MTPTGVGNAAAGAGATVSCIEGFNLHAFLGEAGQIIGLLSGVASISWIVYQWWKSRK